MRFFPDEYEDFKTKLANLPVLESDVDSEYYDDYDPDPCDKNCVEKEMCDFRGESFIHIQYFS